MHSARDSPLWLAPLLHIVSALAEREVHLSERSPTMGRIRALREDDIPDVVALRQKTFKNSDRASSSELAAYMREMFLAGPWRDDSIPSLVYEDASGRPKGFVGVFPRRMVFDGEPIRVAVFSQLMVDAECHGLAGLALLREL